MTATIADLQISSKSLQYVRCPITEATGANPTADTVTMAFPTTSLEPTAFYSGDWQTIAGIYYARCLVGTGGAVELAIGFYDVYVKISDIPETPVLFAGRLEVT